MCPLISQPQLQPLAALADKLQTVMKLLLSFLLLDIFFFLTASSPPTCYSRVVSLSQEITESFLTLQRILPAGRCKESLPTLNLDIHNSCVMTKLRSFINAPNCGRFPRVTALKKKVRNLYNIMNSVCKRDLVFFIDDCDALEHPSSTTPTPSDSR
ncbi:LOW QUALITY PROTEIN: cytokine-like protein 1 [Dendropsophus ebraccatus]|uniref:LOW QUALITY PROTEIN: cytokine-like protein 1 n=1 Tax=Dendropsophus ebraccatus TaxID=150705 RepID=UPI00383181C5